MNKSIKEEIFTPWYKEPWAYLIVIILLVTVIWGSYRIYFAYKVQDSVVVGDYYKKGKAINQDLTRKKNAEKYDIKGSVHLDELTGDVKLIVTGLLKEWPKKVKLSLLSPLLATQDEVITLHYTFNKDNKAFYSGQLEHGLEGKVYLRLETFDVNKAEKGYSSGWLIQKTYKMNTDINNWIFSARDNG